MKQFFKYIFPGILGLVTYFTIRVLQDSETGYRFWYRPLTLNLLETSLAITMGYISVYVVKKVCRYSDSRSITYQPNSSVIVREVFYIATLNTILVNAIFTPMAAFTSDGLSLGDFVNINIVPLLYVLIYYGVIRSGFYLKAYMQHQLLVEKLTNDQLETELKFLKAQYHPHFLFNALNTIYFQVDDDVPGAKRSIELLSELLRYQLYDNQHTVAVKQELEHLQNFIALQQVRTSKKMVLTLEFDEKLTDQQVYPLLFLPLVENAFKYAGGRYRVEIKAIATADSLLFTVSNDVPPVIANTSTAGGIGIENLNRRLQLLYPDRHTLTLSKHDDCFKAELKLMT